MKKWNKRLILMLTLNEDMKDLKKELTSGDRIITSATHEKINWLLQVATESP